MPLQVSGGIAALVHPRFHRKAVELQPFGILRAFVDGNGEKLLAVAPALALQAFHVAKEALVLRVVIRVRAHLRQHRFLPAVEHEKPLVRIGAGEKLVILRQAVFVAPRDDFQFFEKPDDRARFFGQHRNIVRAPRIGQNIVPAAHGVAAGVFFKLQQREVLHARLVQTVGRAKPRDAAAHDNDVFLQDLGGLGKSHLPQFVTRCRGRAQYLPRHGSGGRSESGPGKARQAQRRQQCRAAFQDMPSCNLHLYPSTRGNPTIPDRNNAPAPDRRAAAPWFAPAPCRAGNRTSAPPSWRSRSAAPRDTSRAAHSP